MLSVSAFTVGLRRPEKTGNGRALPCGDRRLKQAAPAGGAADCAGEAGAVG